MWDHGAVFHHHQSLHHHILTMTTFLYQTKAFHPIHDGHRSTSQHQSMILTVNQNDEGLHRIYFRSQTNSYILKVKMWISLHNHDQTLPICIHQPCLVQSCQRSAYDRIRSQATYLNSRTTSLPIHFMNSSILFFQSFHRKQINKLLFHLKSHKHKQVLYVRYLHRSLLSASRNN